MIGGITKEEVDSARRRFKRFMRGAWCENRLCPDRYKIKPGENGTLRVAEHIVPVSRNRDIACEFENMAYTHGCINLDLCRGDKERLLAIASAFPHKLEYARKNLRSKL